MCYSNFVGLSAKCSNTEPTSGLFVDMLQGISLKKLANITGAENLIAQDLIDEKTQLVFKAMESTGSDFFAGQVMHSIDSIIGRDFSESIMAGASSIRGAQVEKKRTTLSKLYIERIYFKSATAVEDLVITISDGFNSVTKTIDAGANEEVLIELDYSTSGNKVNITYENSDVTPYTGDITPWNTYKYDGCVNCGCDGLRVMGRDEDSYLSSWRGIKVDASVRCDRSKMVCLIAKFQPVAFLYLIGSELMKEAAASDRVNFLTINNKEQAKELSDEFSRIGYGMLADNKIGISEYLQKSESKCFTCNSITYGYSLP